MTPQSKSTSDRVWDVATKLLVPLVMACGVALVRNEIIDSSQDLRLEHLETSLPPKWLRDAVNRIERGVESNSKALSDLDKRIMKLENK